MELEDREIDPVTKLVIETERSEAAKAARRHYFRELFRLQAELVKLQDWVCLLYTSPSPRDRQKSRMPSSA